MESHTQVEIARPAADVFAVLADFSRNPEWQRGMTSTEWTSEPPVGVGSTYDQVARFLGREITTSFEVVAYEPDRSISIESRESSFPIRVTRTVEPLGTERCRASATVAGDPAGFFRLFAPIAGWLAKRSIQQDYRRLRMLMETDHADDDRG